MAVKVCRSRVSRKLGNWKNHPRVLNIDFPKSVGGPEVGARPGVLPLVNASEEQMGQIHSECQRETRNLGVGSGKRGINLKGND